MRWGLRDGGNLFGNNLSNKFFDTGKWRIKEQGQVCAEWNGRSENVCYSVRKTGAKLELVTPTSVSELVNIE